MVKIPNTRLAVSNTIVSPDWLKHESKLIAHQYRMFILIHSDDNYTETSPLSKGYMPQQPHVD